MGAIWAILSIFGYTLDPVLMAKLYRSQRPLAAVAYRGLALSISATPLLLLCSANDFVGIPIFLPILLLAAVTATIANWGFAMSVHYFPVGVSNALVMGLQMLVISALSTIFMSESYSIYELSLFLALALTNLAIANENYDFPSLRKNDILVGISYVFLNGIFQSISFLCVAHVSRELSPILASYLWESLIGVVALATLYVTSSYTKENWRIPKKVFLKVVLYSCPTILGTIGYAFAATHLRVGVVSAMVSGLILTTTLLSVFVHSEHLKPKQWGFIFLATFLLILLNLK